MTSVLAPMFLPLFSSHLGLGLDVTGIMRCPHLGAKSDPAQQVEVQTAKTVEYKVLISKGRR